MDVFGRRFLPAKWMQRRNQTYEMHASGYDRLMNIPYLSGCFMLLRTQAVPLDIVPEDVHQRTIVYVGSHGMIAKIEATE